MKTTTEQLAVQLNFLHAQVIGAMRDALRFAKDAGEVLVTIKKRLKHGQWEPWLDANHAAGGPCRWTARQYTRIYRTWHKLEPVLADGTKLTVNQATKLLAVKQPANPPLPTSVEFARNQIKQTFLMHLDRWSDEAVAALLESDGTSVNRLDKCLEELVPTPGPREPVKRRTDGPIFYHSGFGFDQAVPENLLPGSNIMMSFYDIRTNRGNSLRRFLELTKTRNRTRNLDS